MHKFTADQRQYATRMRKVSVVVPIYNELENILLLHTQLVHALDRLTNDWEIVLVNDGSTDGSTEAIDQIAASNPKTKVVHFRRNFGQTASIMAGIDFSSGDIIVTMDGDLQNDPEDIGALLNKLGEGYDVVSGWRHSRQDTEWGRRWPSQAANRLISWMSRLRLHDYGCTLKAYRRWTIENVRLYGEMHRYIPIYASWQGARVTELPVTHHPRVHGKSKYGLSRIRRVLLDLIVIFFLDRAMDRPMQFFGTAGLYLFGAALVAGLYAVVLRAFEGVSFILTPLPLLFSLLTIAALLCFFFGVLAEVQMRTYFETRNKRAYLVRETKNID
jgi:glycosyltransferase involved in cell wall biosynthesis